MQDAATGTNGDPALTAHDLACRRGDRILFSNLDLTLTAGTSLHVVGANGVGKSSLLRLLAGLARPYAGTVTRHGAVGLLDERPALEPALPLGKALAFWANADALAAPAERIICELLGLDHLLDVPVRYLSTGQKKRAALARLIGQGAPIWLLDEPLNGLDAAAAELVGQVLADHCGEGGICVIASHQPFEAPGKRTLNLAEFAL